MSFANAFAQFATGAAQGSQWAMQTISTAEDIKEKQAERRKREKQEKVEAVEGKYENYRAALELGQEPQAPPPPEVDPADSMVDRIENGFRNLFGFPDTTPAQGQPQAIPAPAPGGTMAAATPTGTMPAGPPPAIPTPGQPPGMSTEQHIRQIVTGEGLPSPALLDGAARAKTGAEPGRPLTPKNWDELMTMGRAEMAQIDPLYARQWEENMAKSLQSATFRKLNAAVSALAMNDVENAIKHIKQGYQFMPDGLDIDARPGPKPGTIEVQRLGPDGKPIGEAMVYDAEGLAALAVQISDPAAYNKILRENREFAHKAKIDTETLALREKEVSGDLAYQQGMLGVSRAKVAEDVRHNQALEALKKDEIAAGLEVARIKAKGEQGLDGNDIRAADKMIVDFFGAYAWPEGISDTAKRSAPSIANGMYRAMGGSVPPSTAAEAAIGLVTNPKNLFWSPDGKIAYVTTPSGPIQVPDMAARMIQGQLDLLARQQADRETRDVRARELEEELARRRAGSVGEGQAIPTDPAEDVLRRRGLM